MMEVQVPSTVPPLSSQFPPRFNNNQLTSPFSPTRRKPLPHPGDNKSPRLVQPLSRKSPSHCAQSLLESSPFDSDGFVIRDLDRFPRGDSPNLRQGQWATDSHGEADIRVKLATPRVYSSPSLLGTHLSHARVWSELSGYRNSSQHIGPPYRWPAPTMANSSAALLSPTIPATLNLPEVPFRSRSPSVSEVTEGTSKAPRSPSTRFPSLFRWGSPSDQEEIGPPSPSTSVSDRSASSLKSIGPSQSYSLSTRSIPPAIDIPRANAALADGLHSDSGVSLAPPTPSPIDTIEEEVRLVSADLAASIRREMELEDLVERLQAEAVERTGESKRTSDYFSDAGTSTRYLDSETKQAVDVEKIQRKAEQDLSRLRLEMLGKVQEERERRKVIQSQVKNLEEQIARRESVQCLNASSSGRVKELEVALEEARRRLAEERHMKENYEDLLTALRGELEEHRNERDNLRDEIVPRLRARIEGLESEASELQKSMYENTQMQQKHSKIQEELLTLRSENATLASAIQVQASAIQTSAIQRQTHQSIIRQSRPVSLMGSPVSQLPNMGLPLNTKDRETLVDKVKDIEEQRDALHTALKSLQERHRYETRRAKERIKVLEVERDKALQQTNRRYGNDREMTSIRKEMERLRHRTDEALESKFRCEKNLGTLKMDLEQAESETATLRALLQEHDSLVSRHSELRDSHLRLSRQVSQLKQEKVNEETSLSLQRAYHDLQDIHERSLARLDELEEKRNDLSEGLTERERRLSEAHSESQRAIQKLKQGVAQAEAERDGAQVEAEAFRKRAETLQDSEKKHLSEERNLGMQLKLSTERIGELASQVCAQLESNNSLRDRLAEAIGRGEEDQKLSAQKINELQERLRVLEDKVLEAQQQTEEAVTRHEEEVRKLKESHTSQLRRLKSTALGSPAQLGSKSPLSPMLRSPRLEWTGFKRPLKSIPDATRVDYLEKRVEELEKALGQADNEMAEVVGRMSVAQIEVMELQGQRDEALRKTRKLQAEIEIEKAKFAKSV